MSLADDIEEFRRNVAKAVEELEEVRGISDKLTECTVDEIQHYLAQLQDLCEQVSVEIKWASDRLIEINARWGSEPLKSYLRQKNQQEVIEKRGRNLIALAMAKGMGGDSGLTDGFFGVQQLQIQILTTGADALEDKGTLTEAIAWNQCR